MRLVIVVLLLTCSVAHAQDSSGFKKPSAKSVTASSKSPVTNAEVRASVLRAWKVLSKGLGLVPSASVTGTVKPGIATKEDVLQEFALLVKAFDPHFKRSPRPANFFPDRIRKDGNAVRMSELISRGFVAPVGPLVTGKSATGLTAKEFGDALGTLMVRIADLSHLPTRFSPNQMGG